MDKLINHIKAFPQLELQDVFKFLHQSTFGCGHMVSSRSEAQERIKSERNTMKDGSGITVQPLEGDFSRVSLNCKLKSETLAGLFYLSSMCPVKDTATLEDKLLRVKELIKDGTLPFGMCEFEKSLEEWRNSGYEARHHSQSFNRLYQPSYRVISNRFVPFLSLLEGLDKMLEKGNVHMCIEGGSASGKSTLAQMLSELYGCTVFHMDDFFLQPHQRTPERFAEAGGNVDYERFCDEVLLPFSRGENVLYRRFDCSKMKIMPPVEMKATRLTVTEGAYSMHPRFAEYYDFKVLLDIDKNLQKTRIARRNPDMKDRFFGEWIPLEERYFEAYGIKNKCDMRIEISEEVL